MNLLVHDAKHGYRAKREVIAAFMPGVKREISQQEAPLATPPVGER